MYLKWCTHDFNLQLLLTIQLLTYEIMSKNIVLTDAMDCETWSVPPHDFLTYESLLSMQLLTYETMSENIDMTDAIYCKTCSLRIDVLSYKDVSVSKFHIGGRVYATC